MHDHGLDVGDAVVVVVECAIDAGRIATLVEYVSDYAEYVVVALLPADARALDDDHDRVTDI